MAKRKPMDRNQTEMQGLTAIEMGPEMQIRDSAPEMQAAMQATDPGAGDPMAIPAMRAEGPALPDGLAPAGPGGAVTMGIPVKVHVGQEQLLKARSILQRYRAGKARQDARVIACEQWWKLRHWDYFDKSGNELDNRPTSAWLFNCIISKHADGIEAFPEPNIRPREVGDKEEAKRLSSIVPVILEQNDFEETYSDVLWQKLQQGTGIYGVFWDKDKLGGLGDIAIRKIDALNIFWEPGISDIQKSRHVFTTELVDVDLIKEMYPEQVGDKVLTGKSEPQKKYIYDDYVDTTDKALVVDWYYHKGHVLHYVKFVDDIVLYATEDDPQWADRGLYDHGMYPFVFDPLFPINGSPAGHGYIDVAKSAQTTIDRMNQALEKNALMGATPRYFVRGTGGVNEDEFADWTKPFVHVTNANLGEDDIRPIELPALNSNYPVLLQYKVEELKETTGNRDAANGGTTAGVTAASAIAAMQEQAGKTSRASTMGAYRAYRRCINMVIELIRQFYDLPRQFRITGEGNQEEFVTYDNSGIKPQYQGMDMGMDMGYRLPVFDVEVTAQKMTAYTKVSQNELALQLFQLGVLNPQNADQALALLDIMDFDHKDLVEDKVRQNGTMYQMLAMYQQIALQLAAQTGRGDIAEALAQNVIGTQHGLSGGAVSSNSSVTNDEVRDSATMGLQGKEHPFVRKSRAQAEASTQPQ